MEKKISDHIHYYIGCEVQIESELFMTEGRKDVIRDTLWSIDADGYIECKNHVVSVADIKPILSKLEDISEDDIVQLFLLKGLDYRKVWTRASIQDGSFIQIEYKCAGEYLSDYITAPIFRPEQFHYLLSKGYWLFGNDWFDEGLIIDRKTLKDGK